MKMAAVQFNAVFGDVAQNLKQVATYCEQAAAQYVQLILFPEFFTSSIGFSPKMLDIAIQSSHVEAVLKALAAQHKLIIGGSYLLFDGIDTHNLFQLVFPNGEVFSHKKDIPTIFENCYYARGDEDHILKTPIGDIGVALCWEMVRYDTLKRLSQKVDFVLAGTCWADLRDGAPLKDYNRTFALHTPEVFAKLLHVPVIHSNHCGQISAYDFPDDQNLYDFQMVGATQIIDGEGHVTARRLYSEGEGLVIADIPLQQCKRKPADIHPDKYWIEDLLDPYLYAWEHLNVAGNAYYQSIAKLHYKERYIRDETHKM